LLPPLLGDLEAERSLLLEFLALLFGDDEQTGGSELLPGIFDIADDEEETSTDDDDFIKFVTSVRC
jgi:hypothetical protein